jgi:hypothetical protein
MTAFAILLALTSVAAPAGAAPSKPYSLAISPDAQAGAATTFTARFAVPTGASQQLGSADLTVPDGFSLVSASVPAPASAQVSGRTVTLRNLAVQPGGSVEATVVARTACTAGVYTWSVLAKQANDFNGPPGNNLNLTASASSLTTTVTGGCGVSLRFVTQPANARVGQVVTGTAYDPAGPPVSVEVIDGSGARVTTATDAITIGLGSGSGPGPLTGTLTVNASAGLASFGDLRVGAAGGYTLSATATGLTGATSTPFRVDTVVSPCLEDLVCTGSAATPGTSSDVSALPDPANPDSGFLALSYNAGASIDCAGYTELSPDTALLTVSSPNRTKAVTLTISKKLMQQDTNNGASFLQFCFGSPSPFLTKSGVISAQQGTFDWDSDGAPDPVYVGLLPDCGVAAPPCVVSRNKDKAGAGVIQANLPAGLVDPMWRG